MNPIFGIAILALASIECSGEELGFYSPFGGKKGIEKLDALEAKADRVIWYDIDQNFDLGLGKIEGEVRHPISHKFEDIHHFLEREKHKELLVVWFDKSVMWNEKEVIAKHTAQVTAQMRKVGYKRVIIFGAHAAGTHYVADTDLKRGNSKASKPR